MIMTVVGMVDFDASLLLILIFSAVQLLVHRFLPLYEMMIIRHDNDTHRLNVMRGRLTQGDIKFHEMKRDDGLTVQVKLLVLLLKTRHKIIC